MAQKSLARRTLLGALALAVIAPGAAAAATPRTERVSFYPNGERRVGIHPSISRHGRFVAYQAPVPQPPCSDDYFCPAKYEIVVYDRATRTSERVSYAPMGGEENGSSEDPSTSRDGRFVAFDSSATDLGPADGNGPRRDVFVRDRATGAIELIPNRVAGHTATARATTPALSANGRYVAFTGWDDDNNGHVEVYDRKTGHTDFAGGGLDPSISPEGRYVAFASGDLEAVDDSSVVVFDRAAGTQETASLTSHEHRVPQSTEASISAGGRYVTFSSPSHRGQVFVRDRARGVTGLVSASVHGRPGNDESHLGVLSASGRYVSFVSEATDLIPRGGGGVFVRDLRRSRTRRVSISTARVPANGGSGAIVPGRGPWDWDATISADGRFAAFPSYATNLAPPSADSGVLDVFVRGPLR